jgi:hypothetical protein
LDIKLLVVWRGDFSDTISGSPPLYLNPGSAPGCGREVTERVKKTTSVPETKKKEELPMKLLDDPKIPTARRKPRRPDHSHKPLDIIAEMGLKSGRPYCTRRRHHHLSAVSANLDPKN